MQPDLDQLSLQQLSNMLISKTRELTQSLELKNFDAIEELLTDVEELQELIHSYWKKKKSCRSDVH